MPEVASTTLLAERQYDLTVPFVMIAKTVNHPLSGISST